MNSTKNNVRSKTRANKRVVKAKFDEPMQALSETLSKINNVPDSLRGYKIPAGTYYDKRNKKLWQYELRATCTKADRLKENKVYPMFTKHNFLMKLRIWAISVINNLFE